MYLFSLILTSFVLNEVWGTLTPSGSVSIDCGGQRTFACTVAAIAGWNITGLMGISALEIRSGSVALASARVTTTDTGLGSTSIITITGFSTSDNGGTVQCVDIDSIPATNGGMVDITVVSTTLASATTVMANGDQCIAANLTWSEPSDSSATTSVSCNPFSSECSSCTSSGCTIGGLTPSTPYTFSVTRRRSGCDNSTVMSSPVMSGGIPSCPTNVRVTDRSSDFSSATIIWDQPTNSPPVTSYNVTCNSSCTAMPCTSGSSNCRVLSVSPCEDYSVTVLTMNSCGSSICTGNTVPMPAQGTPDCGNVVVTTGMCPTITFTPGSIKPSTVIVSSSAPALTQNCSYTDKGIMCPSTATVPKGDYTVSFSPRNMCGLPSSTCPAQPVSVSGTNCRVEIKSSTSSGFNSVLTTGEIIGIIVGLLLLLLLVAIALYFIIIGCLHCFCCAHVGCLGLIMCLCCRKGGKPKSSVSAKRMRSESPVTPPAQPPAQPPSDEYADPQAIRDRKERGKEDKDKIQYAAIDFSAGAGSGAGEVKIHQKEEPVIYTTVQHV